MSHGNPRTLNDARRQSAECRFAVYLFVVYPDSRTRPTGRRQNVDNLPPALPDHMADLRVLTRKSCLTQNGVTKIEKALRTGQGPRRFCAKNAFIETVNPAATYHESAQRNTGNRDAKVSEKQLCTRSIRHKPLDALPVFPSERYATRVVGSTLLDSVLASGDSASLPHTTAPPAKLVSAEALKPKSG